MYDNNHGPTHLSMAEAFGEFVEAMPQLPLDRLWRFIYFLWTQIRGFNRSEPIAWKDYQQQDDTCG
ncbi:MAG: hypothetical protein AAFV93_02165 [Chloroflexota bacterium]